MASESKDRVNLTVQQAEAAYEVRANVCLVSGAGCGKTRVLVEHFLALVEAGVPASNIVAITFTEKAAAEMVERLRVSCVERAQAAPDDEQRARWLEAAGSVEAGAASTIHGLAGRILRGYAFEAGLDPMFTTLDQAASNLLWERACQEEFRHRLESYDETLRALLSDYSLGSLQEMVRSAAQQRFAFRRLAEVARAGGESYRRHVEGTVYALGRDRLDRAMSRPDVQEAVNELKSYQDHGTYDREATDLLINGIETVLAMWPTLSDISKAEEPGEALERFRATPFTTPRKNAGRKDYWPDSATKKVAGDALSLLCDKVVKPAQEQLRAFTKDDLAELTAISQVVSIADAMLDRYQALKQSRSSVDFDDLLERSVQLLRSNAAVQTAVAGQIKSVLVDELQDVSPIQAELIGALTSHGEHLFVVGDEKQSIYRFRQADVKVFQAVKARMRAAETLKELSCSFRFHPKLNAFHNDLFASLMQPGEETELFRTPYRPLDASRTDSPSEPTVEFLIADDGSPRHAREGRMLEARLIATRIHDLRGDAKPLVWDGAQNAFRPPRLSDIAILVRARTDLDLYERAASYPGFCMASGGGLHGNVPLENLEAYFDARAEIGANPKDWRTCCSVANDDQARS